MGAPFGPDNHTWEIKHANDIKSHKQAFDSDTSADGDWNGISIEDTRNLPIIEERYLSLNIRLIQDYGSRKTQRILNEYTCGDVIHGIVEVSNISARPVGFDGFYLSLGGHVAINDLQKGFRKTKTILQMDDDELLIGLPLDKILRPHSKYRKEFEFTIPFQLLEPVCEYGIPQHYELPPSLGLDRSRYGGFLKFNETLGYARADKIGTPIWTSDQAEDLSINYSLEAVLVGRRAGPPRGKRCILKQFEHSIRIIPPSFSSPTKNHVFMHGNIFTEHRVPYRRKTEDLSFLGKFLCLFIPSLRSMSLYQSGTIVISASTAQLALPYRSPELVARQNSLDFKNDHERRNRAIIRDMIPSNQREALRRLYITVRYIPGDSEIEKAPKLRFVEAELLSITGKSISHHIPHDLSYTMLLDQDELNRLRLETQEFADLDVNIVTLPDAFGIRKTKKWNSCGGWFFTGSEYEQDLILDLEYSKRFYRTLVPSFTSCRCFRIYCIRITVIFHDNINRPNLIIPVDIRNMFA